VGDPRGARQLIAEVQAALEALYALEGADPAEAYVVDREVARRLGGAGQADEELLVAEDAEGLSVALFLCPRLLARVEASARAGRPAFDDAALDDWCQLTEGISHFLYLSHVADQQRTATLLELEVQAEVDKFALCLLAGGSGDTEARARQLLSRLFDGVRLRPHLRPAERHRYQEANRLARRYCEGLLPLVRRRHRDRLVGELRYAYRLGASAKLRHLAQRH